MIDTQAPIPKDRPLSIQEETLLALWKPRREPNRAIRDHCKFCMGWDPQDNANLDVRVDPADSIDLAIRECTSPKCPVYGHRFAKGPSPVKAIAAFCLECVGFERPEVRACHWQLCPFWPFRLGKNPHQQESGTRRSAESRKAGMEALRKWHEAQKTIEEKAVGEVAPIQTGGKPSNGL